MVGLLNAFLGALRQAGSSAATSREHRLVCIRILSESFRAVVQVRVYELACVWRITDSGEISNSPHTGLAAIK